MKKVNEVYLKDEYYNPRLRATVPAAWIAVMSDGNEIAICREFEASDKEDAIRIFNQAA